MARPLRIQWPGALYHITHRGNEGCAIFRDDRDRRRLLECVERAVERFALRVHAICLMSNHYHAQVETPRGNLAAAMHWLSTTYTVYFNRRHERSGHLFHGRYWSAVVEKQSYLAELTRYIHLNPVRAGLVARPEAYPWSSYRDYVTSRPRWHWLETGWTLEQFGGANRRGRARYREFVEGVLPADLNDPLVKAVSGAILGSDAFVGWVSDQFLSGRKDTAAARVRRQIDAVPIDEVIRVVAELTGTAEETVRARGRHGNEARELAMYLAQQHSGATNVAIGAAFGGIAGTNVSYTSRKVRERLRRDRDFRDRCRRTERELDRGQTS